MTELLRILEKDLCDGNVIGADGFMSAHKKGDRAGRAIAGGGRSVRKKVDRPALRCRAASIFLVLPQPILEDLDRREEVVALHHQQIDVVEVLTTTKTVRQIVSRIHGGSQFAATGTLKAEVTIALLRDWTVSVQPNDRQFHRQVIANRSQ